MVVLLAGVIPAIIANCSVSSTKDKLLRDQFCMPHEHHYAGGGSRTKRLVGG